MYPAICLKNAEVALNFGGPGSPPWAHPLPAGYVGIGAAGPDCVASAAGEETGPLMLGLLQLCVCSLTVVHRCGGYVWVRHPGCCLVSGMWALQHSQHLADVPDVLSLLLTCTIGNVGTAAQQAPC
jgi:hypothetical protein